MHLEGNMSPSPLKLPSILPETGSVCNIFHFEPQNESIPGHPHEIAKTRQILSGRRGIMKRQHPLHVFFHGFLGINSHQ